MRSVRRLAGLAAAAILLAGTTGAGAQTIEQHGPSAGHLLGTGAAGAITHLATVRVVPTGVDDLIADVAVDPRGTLAYVADVGPAQCTAASSGKGNTSSPDAGVWIVDISDLSAPGVLGFLGQPPETRIVEGIQAVALTTRFFEGHVLLAATEPCGRSGWGGIRIMDVSDPARPVPLGLHLLGTPPSRASAARSVFAWNAGENAYAAVVGSGSDVEILDITNPRRPRLLTRVNLGGLAIDQPEIGLTDSSPRDVTVRRVDVTGDGHAEWVLLVSHGDGGFAMLNVDDPANPVFLGDSDYFPVDYLLLERTGISLPPQGNAHYAELTGDGAFIVGADEDLDPYDANDDFDGWGYVHLIDAQTFRIVDGYGIPEAHDESYALGFGNLSAHEVATDPGNAARVYVSSYSGGLRALDIQCVNPADRETCELVQVGSYLDPQGNDFFGIEAFVRGGSTIVLASDRDSGLWIFRRD
jgi:hypothetical protein